MKRPLRFTLIWAGVLVALAVLAPLAVAGTQTYYVSPAGTGTSCEQSSPCELGDAADEAVNEDSIVVAPGTYTLSKELTFKSIDIGGQRGAPAPVIVTNGHNVRSNASAKPLIHDLRIEGSGAFLLALGIAERIFVSYTGNNYGCSLSLGVTLLDSVCWAHDGGDDAAALHLEASGVTTTITLRNVTAIDTDASGVAIDARTTGPNSPKLTVEGTNVIGRAAHDADVGAQFGGEGSPALVVNLSHSSYATVAGTKTGAMITAPGTNANETGAPLFVNAAAGDFREATGSPTVEVGLNETANGTMALGGEARVLGTCVGGPGITDIGAYEFVPTAACPVPPVAPIVAPLNKFKVEKVKLNKKKGTGTLLVTVPGPGKFTLSGKGVKKASRSSHGSEVLKLAVKPAGKAKKKLAKTGGAKLSLKLKFVPNGGSAAEQTKKVTLVEKVA